MRRPLILLSVFLLVLCTSLAQAGDKEDLEARIIKYHQVWNAKNTGEFVKYFVSNGAKGVTIAAPDGGVFSDPQTEFLNKATLDTAWSHPKVQFDQTPRYIQVYIYGNGTVGVAHYYRIGSQTDANGVTTPVNLRATEVWVKEGGEWRAAHRHLSQWRIGQTSN